MTNYFRIEAPHPGAASTIVLPSPNQNNNQGLLSQVNVVRMMDGSRRTFVKRGGGKRLHRWEFIISRDKMEELVDFVERYRGSTVRAVWRDRKFVGKLTLNPVELRGDGRAGGWPGGEAYDVTVELVEIDE